MKPAKHINVHNKPSTINHLHHQLSAINHLLLFFSLCFADTDCIFPGSITEKQWKLNPNSYRTFARTYVRLYTGSQFGELEYNKLRILSVYLHLRFVSNI